MNIYLVRHAESKAQTEEEYSLDANLSDFGLDQSKLLQGVLSQISFDRVYLSPLKRARQTFEHSCVDCADILFDSRIVEELPPGMYDDNILPYEQLPDYGIADTHDAWEVPVHERVGAFLEEILSVSDCDNILVVCHAGVLNWLLKLFLNPAFEIDSTDRRCRMDNTAVSILEVIHNGRDCLTKWNDTAHLS